MTISTHRRPTGPGDGQPAEADLLERVRGHDAEAFRVLYERHRLAVLKCAHQYTRTTFDAEDLTEEAFARVLKLLNAGAGPRTAFRAYLCTVVRHLAADRGRRSAHEETVEDLPEPREPEHADAMAETVERGYIQRAFEALPNRWRQVLWLGEVEGRKPAEIATLLGMSPRSVSALAYRAREGLSQAYLQAHLSPEVPAGCHRTLERLPAYVRSGLPDISADQVRDHLTGCASCRTRLAELTELDRDLRGLLGPLVFAATATGGTAGVSSSFGRLLGRLKDTVGNHFVGVVASGVATTVIATTAVLGLMPTSQSTARSSVPPVQAAAAPPAPIAMTKPGAKPKAKPPAKPKAKPAAAKPVTKPRKAAVVPVRNQPPARRAPAVSAPAPQPVANPVPKRRKAAAAKVRAPQSQRAKPKRVKHPKAVPHRHATKSGRTKPPAQTTKPAKPVVKPPRRHKHGICVRAPGLRACVSKHHNGRVKASIKREPDRRHSFSGRRSAAG